MKAKSVFRKREGGKYNKTVEGIQANSPPPKKLKKQYR